MDEIMPWLVSDVGAIDEVIVEDDMPVMWQEVGTLRPKYE